MTKTRFLALLRWSGFYVWGWAIPGGLTIWLLSWLG